MGSKNDTCQNLIHCGKIDKERRMFVGPIKGNDEAERLVCTVGCDSEMNGLEREHSALLAGPF